MKILIHNKCPWRSFLAGTKRWSGNSARVRNRRMGWRWWVGRGWWGKSGWWWWRRCGGPWWKLTQKNRMTGIESLQRTESFQSRKWKWGSKDDQRPPDSPPGSWSTVWSFSQGCQSWEEVVKPIMSQNMLLFVSFHGELVSKWAIWKPPKKYPYFCPRQYLTVFLSI